MSAESCPSTQTFRSFLVLWGIPVRNENESMLSLEPVPFPIRVFSVFSSLLYSAKGRVAKSFHDCLQRRPSPQLTYSHEVPRSMAKMVSK